METIVKKLYEAMFLVDSAQAADWDAVVTTIKNILERAEAEIVSIKKWDDRKLAYEINGKTRGTYILCYLRAEGGRIQDVERDVQLSEQIMRVLILNAEHITQEDRVSAREAEESKQSAEPVAAGASETEQPEQDEGKGQKEPGAEESGEVTEQ